VQPVRDDRSWLSFSHGSRACSRDGGCGAEMFFSLLYTYFIRYYLSIWAAKLLISFELRKFSVKISTTFCVFFQKSRDFTNKISNFAAENETIVTFLGI
jgi:hypothetical protein